MRKYATVFATVTLTIGGLVMTSIPAAQAAAIPDAITNVTTSGQARVGDVLTLKADWKIPDYSQAGDTFTLDLPAEFIPLTDSFSIVDDGGNAIAQATVSNGMVTVTLTDFVENNPVNVHGDLTFSVRIADTAPAGQPITLHWGGTSTVITPIAPDVVPEQVTEPVKYGWSRSSGEIGWAFDIPGQMSNVVLKDDPANVHLLCDSVYVKVGDQTNGYPLTWNDVDSSQYTLNCDSEGFTLSLNEIAPNDLVHVVLSSTPDEGITQATNTWSLSADETNTGGEVSSAVYEGSGFGAGEPPAPVATSAPLETPVPVATPVPLETPAPEVTQTPAPSETPEVVLPPAVAPTTPAVAASVSREENPHLVDEPQKYAPSVNSHPNYTPAQSSASAGQPTGVQRLAHTGFSNSQIVLAAIALVALGGAMLVMVLRRRKA